MTIQSLGVGSGLALDDLVQQLLDAERLPKEERLNTKEEKIEAEISGLGQIKSKLSDFKDAVDDLRSDTDINGREPTIVNPSEDDDVLSADASSSALRGSYDITVQQLASGSRITTDAGAFTSSSDPVLSSGTGSLTFSIPGGDSFTINVDSGTSLVDLREAINSADDNFGVTANIIDTGTAEGPRLVFLSEETGDGNDLVINNDTGAAELDRLSTAGGTNNISAANIESAKNAIAFVDGIEVQSQSNKFENTIQNVTFDVNEISPKDNAGNFLSTTLKIGFDKEGLEQKIRDFVDNYNAIIDEIGTLTRYGESELEEDGALAGDSLLRGIQSGLSSIIGDNVSTSQLGGLFRLGIELDEDGKLEISSSDFGIGSGEDRLKDALEDNFDDIATLFTDENEGIAVRLYDFVDEFTSSGGLISLREKTAKENREGVYSERETLELRMFNYEQILRSKYLNLDQTVAQLNQTSSALLAALQRTSFGESMSLKGINAYKKGNLKQDVANADPHKLTLMLLQGALDRIAYAKGAMERKELQEKATFISKATAIIIHLRDTLDVKVGGEVAENMFALYEFMIEKLNEAHVNNDIKLLDEVSSLLSPIRDAWVQIPQEAKEEAFRAQRESKQAI